MSLLNFAKRELNIAGMHDEDSDYEGATGKDVLALIELFANQGHSEGSAMLVLDMFNKLARFKPLTPLTFVDAEWMDVAEMGGDEMFQNVRNSAVFKKGKDGRPYYINAFCYTNQEGHSYQGSLSVGEQTLSKCYIKNPNYMPTISIDVIDWEVNEDTNEPEEGSGWWVHRIKDMEQLDELRKYYILDIDE